MCGLAGLFAYTADAPPVDPEELLRVRERMQPRGPDGAGLWLSDDGRIGLAHCRLSIIDLSEAGAQPMPDPDTGHRIVLNGAIDNYRAWHQPRLPHCRAAPGAHPAARRADPARVA